MVDFFSTKGILLCQTGILLVGNMVRSLTGLMVFFFILLSANIFAATLVGDNLSVNPVHNGSITRWSDKGLAVSALDSDKRVVLFVSKNNGKTWQKTDFDLRQNVFTDNSNNPPTVGIDNKRKKIFVLMHQRNFGNGETSSVYYTEARLKSNLLKKSKWSKPIEIIRVHSHRTGFLPGEYDVDSKNVLYTIAGKEHGPTNIAFCDLDRNCKKKKNWKEKLLLENLHNGNFAFGLDNKGNIHFLYKVKESSGFNIWYTNFNTSKNFEQGNTVKFSQGGYHLDDAQITFGASDQIRIMYSNSADHGSVNTVFAECSSGLNCADSISNWDVTENVFENHGKIVKPILNDMQTDTIGNDYIVVEHCDGSSCNHNNTFPGFVVRNASTNEFSEFVNVDDDLTTYGTPRTTTMRMDEFDFFDIIYFDTTGESPGRLYYAGKKRGSGDNPPRDGPYSFFCKSDLQCAPNFNCVKKLGDYLEFPVGICVQERLFSSAYAGLAVEKKPFIRDLTKYRLVAYWDEKPHLFPPPAAKRCKEPLLETTGFPHTNVKFYNPETKHAVFNMHITKKLTFPDKKCIIAYESVSKQCVKYCDKKYRTPGDIIRNSPFPYPEPIPNSVLNDLFASDALDLAKGGGAWPYQIPTILTFPFLPLFVGIAGIITYHGVIVFCSVAGCLA